MTTVENRPKTTVAATAHNMSTRETAPDEAGSGIGPAPGPWVLLGPAGLGAMVDAGVGLSSLAVEAKLAHLDAKSRAVKKEMSLSRLAVAMLGHA